MTLILEGSAMPIQQHLSTLIDQLYILERITSAIEKQPKTHMGVPLHANEAHTLKLIAQNEGISQTDLSDRMYRTKGATSVAVDKLVKKGLIRREREEGNQRRYLLTLTDLGRQVNAAHLCYDDDHTAWAARHLDLTEEELAVTIKTMDRIIALYSQHYLEHGVCVGRRDEISDD